jgi:hypothetical protein
LLALIKTFLLRGFALVLECAIGGFAIGIGEPAHER